MVSSLLSQPLEQIQEETGIKKKNKKKGKQETEIMK